MSDRKRIRGKELAYQDIDDIFEEFYQIQSIIDVKSGRGDINYIIIRLVTILEQFFRFVVECSLEKDPSKTPTTIEIEPSMIDSVSKRLARIPEEYIRNYVVSLSYSFQNQHDILNTMDRFGILNKRKDIKVMINNLTDLFQLRHKMVHTVEQQNTSLEQIKNHYTDIESLMHEILDVLKPSGVSFYYLKMDVLINFALRENKKKNFEAGKHYAKEIVTYRCKAMKYLEERVSHDVRDIDAYSQLMGLCETFGDRQNIQKYSKAILEIDSEEPWANYHTGKALKTENPLKALEHFKKAVETEPNEPKFYADLIILLIKQKQYVESLSYIDEAIENLPHEPSFYMSRGLVFTSFKMPEYANVCYKNADKHAIDYVKMFPEDVHGCDDLLKQLKIYGRDYAIAECRMIIDEYWKRQQQ